MMFGSIARLLAFGTLVAVCVLVLPRGGGAHEDASPFNQGLACVASVGTPVIDASSYGIVNNAYIFNITSHVDWSCSVAVNNSCAMCIFSVWSTATTVLGPWTTGCFVCSSVPRPGACDTNYTTSLVSTYSGSVANTFYRGQIAACACSNPAQCSQNPDNYNFSGSVYFSGNGP